eukprot:767349-Hanusia_phi.AAC.6
MSRIPRDLSKNFVMILAKYSFHLSTLLSPPLSPSLSSSAQMRRGRYAARDDPPGYTHDPTPRNSPHPRRIFSLPPSVTSLSLTCWTLRSQMCLPHPQQVNYPPVRILQKNKKKGQVMLVFFPLQEVLFKLMAFRGFSDPGGPPRSEGRGSVSVSDKMNGPASQSESLNSRACPVLSLSLLE